MSTDLEPPTQTQTRPPSAAQPQTRTHPVRALVLFTLVVFLGGALLAPVLYWLVQAVAPHSHLASSPFHRYVNRALLFLALAGIWPLLRGLGATSWRDVGLVNPFGQGWRWAAGLALGFGSLGCLALIALASHGRAFNNTLSADQLTVKLLGAALSAAVVPVVEEILFRGAIFGALRRISDWRVALVASSMIYAIVHFLKRADITGPVTWSSGLRLLPLMLAGFGDLQVVVPGFFNLTVVGILLGLAYQKTGNLYCSMGMHAGWIFWLASYRNITISVNGSSAWVWGTENPINGWMALAVLALTWVVLLRLPLSRPRPAMA